MGSSAGLRGSSGILDGAARGLRRGCVGSSAGLRGLFGGDGERGWRWTGRWAVRGVVQGSSAEGLCEGSSAGGGFFFDGEGGGFRRSGRWTGGVRWTRRRTGVTVVGGGLGGGLASAGLGSSSAGLMREREKGERRERLGFLQKKKRF